jgi:hypothetical protein
MIQERWRMRLVLVALFSCGGLLGGALVQLRTSALLRDVLGGPPETIEARVKLLMLERGLSLSSEQSTRIRPILERAAARARAVRSRIEPDLAPIRDQERQAVGAELTGDQRRDYERRLKQIDAALGRTR